MTIAEIELGYDKIFIETGMAAKWEAMGEARGEAKYAAVIADKDAEIARLRAELESRK